MSRAGAEVVVAGGGPAGLAAAFRLQEAGHRVRVLEAAKRPGSKLASERRDGFLVDRGAFFIPTTHDRFLRMAEDAGISGELVPGGFGFGLARGGEIHQLDGDHLARDFLRSGVVSARAKLGAAKLAPELIRARRARVDRIEDAARYDTETVTAWAERKLNRELADYVIDPAIRAVFATEGDEVSRVEFLGLLALFSGAKMVAFREGMGYYADRLAAKLDVTAGAEVVEVRQTEAGADVTWRDRDGERTETVAGCVVALPARLAAGVLPGLGEWRREYLRAVKPGRLVVVTLALARAPAGLDATYTMIPRAEHPFLAGILCDHNKAPDRAPPGKGLLTLALSNPWCEEHFEDDDDALVRTALEAVEGFLPGTSDALEFAEVTRWTQQYGPVGHYARLAEFRARGEKEDRTVRLAGEYLASPHLSAATAMGERAASELSAELARRI